MGSICKCFIVELSTKKERKEEKNSFNNGQFTYLRIYIKTANRHTGFERLYEYVLSLAMWQPFRMIVCRDSRFWDRTDAGGLAGTSFNPTASTAGNTQNWKIQPSFHHAHERSVLGRRPWRTDGRAHISLQNGDSMNRNKILSIVPYRTVRDVRDRFSKWELLIFFHFATLQWRSRKEKYTVIRQGSSL